MSIQVLVAANFIQTTRDLLVASTTCTVILSGMMAIRISKEKLIQLVRESKQKEFVVVQGREGSYAVVPVTSVKKLLSEREWLAMALGSGSA